MKKAMNVPVIMYHSIGVPNKKWIYNHLTCPYELFESQLHWMKKKNFHTTSLQDLYNYMNEGMRLPKNPVVLTFDDGYLDNWVFAYPLLKKYESTGTIFVSPEFVCPEKKCRKTVQDVWAGEIEAKELETTGYLSWGEMKEMIDEKVMDIQSHAMTHTLYYKSNKIIDFRHPNDPYLWVTWNNHPNEKPYLQMDRNELIDYGEPIYEYGNALNTKRYFSDENLSKYITTYVAKQDVNDFFKNTNWRDKLSKIVGDFKKEHMTEEKFETEEEYKKRVQYELQKSKEVLEEKLDIDVKFLCWPIGGTSEEALKIASNLGYISSTVARDIDKKTKRSIKNKVGNDPSRIRRIGAVLYWNKILGENSNIKYKNGYLMGLSLYQFQGKLIPNALNKFVFLSQILHGKV